MTYFKRLSIILLLVLIPYGCVSSGLGSTLGTTVNAKQDKLTVSWNTKHPWDGKLNRSSALVVAEYVDSSNKLARETLATSRTNGNRQYSFELPSSLKGSPESDVCLYIQLQNSTKILPVRTKNKRTGDTGRFFYDDWSDMVANQSKISEIQKGISDEEKMQTESKAYLEKLSVRMKVNSIDSVESCNDIKLNTEASERPYDVIEPNKQLSAAQLSCVYRAKNSKITETYFKHGINKILSGQENSSQKFNLLQQFIGTSPQGATDLRQLAHSFINNFGKNEKKTQYISHKLRQAYQIDKDYKLYIKSIRGEFIPFIGDKDSYISLPSEAAKLKRLILIHSDEELKPLTKIVPPLPKEAYLSYTGAAFDAYEGCVSDSEAQLAVKYKSWMDLQKNKDHRISQKKVFLKKECIAEFKNKEKLNNEILESEKRVATLTKDLQSLQKKKLRLSKQKLNDKQCTF